MRTSTKNTVRPHKFIPLERMGYASSRPRRKPLHVSIHGTQSRPVLQMGALLRLHSREMSSLGERIFLPRSRSLDAHAACLRRTGWLADAQAFYATRAFRFPSSSLPREGQHGMAQRVQWSANLGVRDATGIANF